MATGTKTIKPTHRSVKAYYETLKRYAGQDVSHETAVRSAFQNLLADIAKLHGWTLIPELSHPAKTGAVRPDGTIRDNSYLPRGYWEAKDTSDDLDAEIRRKIGKGYPIVNTIFEDTRTAVLYQGKQETRRIDLSDANALASLLNDFFAYSEPDIDQFEQAVTEFKERVPELALGLTEKIRDAHKNNPRFIAAFSEFFKLCQTSLNPNISVAAVDEMLVQHLLTERLFRTIFDNEEFTQRNVIAAEVEKVITALVSKSFNRHEFLKSLDRFYVAIEEAARGLEDFTEKQHFLNTVYERFFQGYSVKVADTHGIVYTPQPIVDFMCASVAEVLEKEFGKPLGSPNVHILDPCTGTGNFIVNLLRRIPKRDLPRMYREQLFANEVMLLPYYIAALNIEHAHYELTGEYEPFEGLCFVDSLDMAEHAQTQFGFMTEANTERVERQKGTPITVILGNPPYNVGQLNENDNNKNRKYDVVDRRIAETYAADSKATLKNKLYDAYVKFFRWATDRLEQRDGIICFISNNSFVDQVAFDGMQRHLMRDFTHIFHIDLHGNVRKNPKLSGTTHNVFGIQVGVGITVAVRRRENKSPIRPHSGVVHYYRVPEFWRKEEKLQWLTQVQSISGFSSGDNNAGVIWQRVASSTSGAWLSSQDDDLFSFLVPLGNKETKAGTTGLGRTLFEVYSLGVSTNRDDVVYDFAASALDTRIAAFVDAYNAEVDRYKHHKRDKEKRTQEESKRGAGVPVNPQNEDIDAFVNYSKIKWSSTLKEHLRRLTYASFERNRIGTSCYRPFCKRYLYYDRVIIDRPALFRRILPTLETELGNRTICVSGIGSGKPFHALITNVIPSLDAIEKTQCFPFYVYNEDGSNRRDNITDWVLAQFREKYGEKKSEGRKEKRTQEESKRGAGVPVNPQSAIGNRKPAIEKWDVFYYVYGLLHHPGYRTKHADNLKRELPRIPFAPDFWAFSEAGRELAHWHLDYEQVDPYPLKYEVAKDRPLSYRVEDKMRLSKDKTSLTVNPSLTLSGIPPQAFEYRLGNRSALEWVIDQYQVKHDEKGQVTSDPNRADDPEYIVRLTGQVVRVSLETVRIVDALPADFGG